MPEMRVSIPTMSFTLKMINARIERPAESAPCTSAHVSHPGHNGSIPMMTNAPISRPDPISRAMRSGQTLAANTRIINASKKNGTTTIVMNLVRIDSARNRQTSRG